MPIPKINTKSVTKEEFINESILKPLFQADSGVIVHEQTRKAISDALSPELKKMSFDYLRSPNGAVLATNLLSIMTEQKVMVWSAKLITTDQINRMKAVAMNTAQTHPEITPLPKRGGGPHTVPALAPPNNSAQELTAQPPSAPYKALTKEIKQIKNDIRQTTDTAPARRAATPTTGQRR